MPADLRIAGGGKTPNSDERLCEPLVPGQLGREAFEVVGKIQASFLKAVESGLSELLQTPVTMSPGETTQAPFSSAVRDAGHESHVIALDLAPVRGRGFLAFPLPLLFRVLDILLATPQTTSPETMFDESGRVVTSLELHILREFFEVFTQSLRDAWQPFCAVSFRQRPEGEEAAPPADGDDLALAPCATIFVGDGISADVRLVVPAFLARMAQLKSAASAGHTAGSEPVLASVLKCLGDATLRMEAALEGGSIRIRNLLDLTPGQVLVFGNAEGSSVDCLVNGRRQFTGALVSMNGRCAIQIDGMPDAGMPAVSG